MRYEMLFLVAAFICGPAVAFTQAPKEVPRAAKLVALPPVSANPERTTASFGDWVMRCETVGTLAKRVCEVAQIVTVQGQSNPIAQIAIGKPTPTSSRQVTLVLPTHIAFAIKPQLAVARTGVAPLDLDWQRCMQGGCFASAPITDGALMALGAETRPGKISFKDAADREIALPLSFRGLSQALAALAKEP